ncbi:NACHT, LRR and PYD domains-containing protein 11 [Orycteropus afer afer]|uniref:NACHT, LRR and PYD domains-containing protein 11 n=1 Tax=Orycteropus afer afer TaxID=1230840 RepID=A0AC54Z7F0_ORYAF|nr:NACHT, LRR and PYD domains-containing protein 11 [Orycteropus afer afer]
MAELSSADSDLLWHLKKLKNKEFQSVKEHLIQAPLEFGLPEIPWLQLRKAQREDLGKMLTAHYEAQITWNMMFSIFQKINRQDLCMKIEARRTRNKEIHKDLMHEKFLLQWEKCIYPNINDEFYNGIASGIHRLFEMAFDPKGNMRADNFNVFLVGERASGKTMLIKMAMLQWVKGDIWKDTFSYIVHLTSREVNQMAHSSLVELLSKDWPNGQAPVEDILSDSKKLLFILEDLDNIKFAFNIAESALCSDSRKQVPASVLLVSLLKRKMAPSSSFLISTRTEPQVILDSLAKQTDYSITLNFSDEIRQKYFTLFFEDKGRAMTAFKFIQDNEILVALCSVPISCWIACTTLNQQMYKVGDVNFTFRTSTDTHAHFLTNALTSGAGMPTVGHHLILLERLSLLALEGLFQDMLEFSHQDLRTIGLTESEVSMLKTTKILMWTNHLEDRCTFIHLHVQEFCAAIAYMMPLTASQIFPTNRELERRAEYNDFSPVMTFIFGLLNEKTRDILETSFGCQLSSEVHRRYLLERMENLASNPEAMEHHVPLFYCLFENQEEEFVKQIMGFFVEAAILIRDNKDLMVSSYCLKRCRPLEKLRLCIQYVFVKSKFDMKLTSSQMRSLIHWKDLCSLLHTKENLRELEVCNSEFDDTSERILCKALEHPNCQLQTFSLSGCFFTSFVCRDIASAITTNQYLRSLELGSNNIGDGGVELLSNALKHPNCKLENLGLEECRLTSNCCETLVSVLIKNKSLKKLNLLGNKLDEKGIVKLLQGLGHPDCMLQTIG